VEAAEEAGVEAEDKQTDRILGERSADTTLSKSQWKESPAFCLFWQLAQPFQSGPGHVVFSASSRKFRFWRAPRT